MMGWMAVLKRRGAARRGVPLAFVALLFAGALLLAAPGQAWAKTVVAPSGDTTGKTDALAIQKALDKDKSVELKSGETYYIGYAMKPKNGRTLKATGATVIADKGAVINVPKTASYGALKNVTINGGTWRSSDEAGYKGSMFQLYYAQNVTIANATIHTNYAGHGIELVACKDVRVKKCNVLGVGVPSANCAEEQIQIDVAAPKTAPFLKKLGAKFVNGTPCENITISNCTVRGGRAVCASYAKNDGANINSFHKHISVLNSKLTGVTAEGLALFNVRGATVKKSTIISQSARTGEAYSVGLHVHTFGNTPGFANNARITIANNTIKGGRQGLYSYAQTATPTGQFIVTGNRIAAKAGAGAAKVLKGTTSLSQSGNAVMGWNGKGSTGTWVKTGSKYKYRTASGTYLKGLKAPEGVYYYFDNKGVAKTGWFTVKGKKYHAAANGALDVGWQTIGGKSYYFSPAEKTVGQMKTGWLEVNGGKYYLGTNGVAKKGLQKIGGKTYYFGPGNTVVTGMQKIGSKRYYFSKTGEAKTGLVTISGKKYYVNTDGSFATGLKTVNGKKYYFGTNGAAYTSAWKTVKNKTYYFGSNGVAYTGPKTIKGKDYYFASNGVRQTGLHAVSGEKYWYTGSGKATSCWKKDGNNVYYFGKTGAAVTSWQTIEGKKYYFGTDCVKRTGWQTIGGKKYYLGSNGVMVTGWKSIDGGKYYFDSKGVMSTGWKTVDGKKYNFGTNGAALKGWQTVGNQKYYFGDDGVTRTGLRDIDGKKYYLGDDGAMRTGMQTVKSSGNTYYFQTSGSAMGAAVSGWQRINGKIYYFSEQKPSGSNVPYCQMYKDSTRTIGNDKYTFDSNGVLQLRDGQVAPI